MKKLGLIALFVMLLVGCGSMPTPQIVYITSTPMVITIAVPTSTKEPIVEPTLEPEPSPDVGHKVSDPTFSEVVAFLNSSTVNWELYKDGYVCWNFACDLQKDAYEKGIRSAFVGISFPKSGHAIIAFETTDKGLVYIEPQIDLPVQITIGVKYWSWFWGAHDYAIDYDDTVRGIALHWELDYCDILQ